MSAPYDRPAHGEPGGCECFDCGVIFIGAPWHSQCAVCAAQAVSPVPASIPSAVLDEVAFAIEQARCPGREGPYGGYDYGFNPAFYGPPPEGGRYVVRDFRKFDSPSWGEWVHQTDSAEEHEQAFLRLTGRHVAQAAIDAYAQGMEARQGQDGEAGLIGEADDSPVSREADAPQSPRQNISDVLIEALEECADELDALVGQYREHSGNAAVGRARDALRQAKGEAL